MSRERERATPLQGDTSEAAHTVYNQLFTMHLDDVGQFFDRIQDTGRCFAMNESDMCDIGVIAKIIVYIFN